jgi:hypothetical protein
MAEIRDQERDGGADLFSGKTDLQGLNGNPIVGRGKANGPTLRGISAVPKYFARFFAAISDAGNGKCSANL